MTNQHKYFKTISKRILSFCNLILLKLLPRNIAGDYIYSLMLFLTIHKRFPKKQNGSLNDALFYIKTSKEITNPLRVYVSDKEFVKTYIKNKIGDEFNVPTIAVLQNLAEATAYNFPNRCVIKPTHMCNTNIFRKHGENIDFKEIARWYNTNYYEEGREANYKTLIPKVIVEPFIFDNDIVSDYRFFCINGKPIIILVDTNINYVRNLYTPNWDLLPFNIRNPIGPGLPKPKNLAEMIRIATILSEDFNFIRIDLYSNGETIYAGEITNCHGNASAKFVPPPSEELFANLVFGRDGFSIVDFQEKVLN